MEVLVVGAGAVGAFYGGKLSQGGAKVSVIARSDYETVKTHGFQIDSHWGDFHFTPENVYRSVSEISTKPDVILVALKVLPEVDTVALIKDAVGPDTTIFLIQNGIDIERPLTEAFPENEIISALAFLCCFREGPGHIVHQDVGRIKFGTYPKGFSKTAEQLSTYFEKSGTPVLETENVLKARWEKLVWNAPFNPISVLGGGINTKEMLEDPESAKLCRAVMDEVLAISRSIGEPLEGIIADNNMKYTYEMAPYYTSMCLDFKAGRPLEVEAILGNPVKIARKNNVPVPHMESIYALLRRVNYTLEKS